jgi:lipid-binding SYLF domain-containing protein
MHRAHRSVVPALFRGVGLVTAALALGACSSSSEHAQSPAAVDTARADVLVRLDQSADSVTQFRRAVADDVAARARCVVVVPTLKKGGLIVGGQSGRGFATCRTADGWSGPAPVQVGGGTFGAQVGFQSSDVLALVMRDEAMRTLEAGKLKVGVDASAAAGPVGTGRGRQFGDAEILSYSRSSGLFAGATLDGTGIDADQDAIVALYGPAASFGSILEAQMAPPPQAEVNRFLAAMREAFPRAPVAQSSR